MLVLRGTIIVFSFIAVALTLYFPTVLSLQMTAYTMYGAAITPAILFALFSKKVTPGRAAWPVSWWAVWSRSSGR